MQEVLQVFWKRKRVYRFPEQGMGLKVTATGLEPKPAIAKGMGSGLILVLPRSLMLWMAKGLWSMAEGKMMMGSGSLPRLRKQVAASNDGLSMMEAKELMLSVDFLKLGWFLMAEAQVSLVAIVMIVLVARSCSSNLLGFFFFIKL
jgi:hypothetical protein